MEMTFKESQDKIEENLNKKRDIEKSLKRCIEIEYYEMARFWIEELIVLQDELKELSENKII